MAIRTAEQTKDPSRLRDEDYFKNPNRPPPPSDAALNTSFWVKKRTRQPSAAEIARAEKGCRKLEKELSGLREKREELSELADLLADENEAWDVRVRGLVSRRPTSQLVVGIVQATNVAINILLAFRNPAHLFAAGCWTIAAAISFGQYFSRGDGPSLSPVERKSIRITDRITASSNPREARREELERIAEKGKKLDEHIEEHQNKVGKLRQLLKEVKAPEDQGSK